MPFDKLFAEIGRGMETDRTYSPSIITQREIRGDVDTNVETSAGMGGVV